MNGEPDFLSTLRLQDTGASTGETILTGASHWSPGGRVFGGQVLAQCIVAAQHTIEDRDIHSMHGYFLRPGDIDVPITFAVERIHDGRSFATRRVQAYQRGVPIFSMIASFQRPDEGVEHQDPFPVDTPDPETLPSAASILAPIDDPVAQAWAERSIDLRHVDGPVFVDVQGEQVAHQAVWFRVQGELPDDPALHRAVLGYASDLSLLEPIMRRHGMAWGTPGVKLASLDHAMWWHRDARADEWVLYAQESPSAQGGRGLAFGRMFARDGRLLASVAQEGMMRVPR
ncbi:acyl-CoA thioesterase II [Curtobacterium sp. MCSS17_007]|uniref:acyl-CoA thioesterase n=1 Tax=Curtobacterium sp. MCSS17_007 TaxID=2175646 RepID=UPI000DAA315A|nr:acyl-CoA thioesterase II [Curtobacterium sp. MCSS17_007]WIE76552.1 acyl-CoA thioesterase II [Curtobacterium sp. MCSS17_007]